MGDLDDSQITQSHDQLYALHGGDRVSVPKEKRFLGFDAFKHAITEADVVILATPPGFRSFHFEETVRQGKHAFMEKPVAVDAPGVRRVLAAAAEAKKKKLIVGTGFQRHHQRPYLEAYKRVQEGAIGRIVSASCSWLGTARAGKQREPAESELQYQLRNWYFFTWLQGDHIVEQHCHNIDAANWFIGSHPIKAQGIGGRQSRIGKEHGQIFDHHFVEYEYTSGVRLYSQCRQTAGCFPRVNERFEGTEGVLDTQQFTITGKNPWRFREDRNAKKNKESLDAYQLEHNDLFAAIRAGADYNEAEYAAHSTMTAIMGRMATYSGQLIEWDSALNDLTELVPHDLTWDSPAPVLPDADGFYPVARPPLKKV
jgi:predicted dehydrogenase